MPSVADMINKMAKLGINEDTPDVSTQNIYLSYINSTWLELYGEIAKAAPNRTTASQTVAIVAGSGGTLSPVPQTIISVRDVGNNLNPLIPITYADLENIDPALVATGPAVYFYREGLNTIRTYPRQNTSLRVTYRMEPDTFTLTTSETDIPLPKTYQEVLMWGALRLLNLDERDKGVGQEISLAETMYQRLKSNLISWLSKEQVGVETRVKAYLA